MLPVAGGAGLGAGRHAAAAGGAADDDLEPNGPATRLMIGLGLGIEHGKKSHSLFFSGYNIYIYNIVYNIYIIYIYIIYKMIYIYILLSGVSGIAYVQTDICELKHHHYFNW